MSRVVLKAFAAAVAFHAIVLLFGGLLFFRPHDGERNVEEVDLLTDDAPKPADDEKKDEQEKENEQAPAAESETDLDESREAPPDLGALAQLEAPVQVQGLDAMSLADLESALAPDLAGDGSFGASFSLASGGRIGGIGTGGDASIAETLDAIASASELDQRPRAIVQTPPTYPSELRKKKIAGTVEVTFLVDESGRVAQPRVERSTDPTFDRAALDAVRRWRFEPGTRGGKKVSFKMRVPIAFRADS